MYSLSVLLQLNCMRRLIVSVSDIICAIYCKMKNKMNLQQTVSNCVYIKMLKDTDYGINGIVQLVLQVGFRTLHMWHCLQNANRAMCGNPPVIPCKNGIVKHGINGIVQLVLQVGSRRLHIWHCRQCQICHFHSASITSGITHISKLALATIPFLHGITGGLPHIARLALSPMPILNSARPHW